MITEGIPGGKYDGAAASSDPNSLVARVPCTDSSKLNPANSIILMAELKGWIPKGKMLFQTTRCSNELIRSGKQL